VAPKNERGRVEYSMDIFILEPLDTQLSWVPGADRCNRPPAKSAKPEEFMDTRFVKQLDESGFIKSLYPGR
jgi:hypothetical protein